ncbi:DUF1080 domain-containing protein, partial [bacterium]|nr:DUF1080 domain-containing protein [bacterium]
MRGWMIVCVALVLAAGLAVAAEAEMKTFGEPDADGFVSICNGKDLTNWDGVPELWSVKDGVIRGEHKGRRGNTFCIWRGGLIGDCELKVTFRINSGNSGIQYRSVDVGNHVVSGYQAEVENKKGKVGFLYHESGRGWLVNVGDKMVIHEDGKKEVVGKLGDKMELTKDYQMKGWNTYRFVCDGNHIQHFLNGVQTIDLIDKQLDAPDAKKPDLKKGRLEGILALQLHG